MDGEEVVVVVVGGCCFLLKEKESCWMFGHCDTGTATCSLVYAVSYTWLLYALFHSNCNREGPGVVGREGGGVSGQCVVFAIQRSCPQGVVTVRLPQVCENRYHRHKSPQIYIDWQIVSCTAGI